jgi:hypothetical protein
VLGIACSASAQGPRDGHVRHGKVDRVDGACEARVPGVDTDDAPWSEWSDADGGYVWREDVIGELLSRDDGVPLYVSGTVSNQAASTRSSTRSFS